MTPSSALERVSKKDEALSLALGALSPRHAGRPVGPPTTSQVVTASHVMPPLEAVYGEFPDIVDDRLRSVLAEGGIEQPYVHQSEAISHALAGRHVVVVHRLPRVRRCATTCLFSARFWPNRRRVHSISFRRRLSLRISSPSSICLPID